jgi:hypothetical protein
VSRVCARPAAASTIARVTTSDPARPAARAAANRARELGAPLERAERLTWAEARAEAPWPARGVKVEQEGDYREAYAQELVELGAALGPNNRRTSGPSGPSGKTKLPRRLFSAPAEEFERQDKLAVKAGKSWNAWALEHLSNKTT